MRTKPAGALESHLQKVIGANLASVDAAALATASFSKWLGWQLRPISATNTNNNAVATTTLQTSGSQLLTPGKSNCDKPELSSLQPQVPTKQERRKGGDVVPDFLLNLARDLVRTPTLKNTMSANAKEI